MDMVLFWYVEDNIEQIDAIIPLNTELSPAVMLV